MIRSDLAESVYLAMESRPQLCYTDWPQRTAVAADFTSQGNKKIELINTQCNTSNSDRALFYFGLHTSLKC